MSPRDASPQGCARQRIAEVSLAEVVLRGGEPRAAPPPGRIHGEGRSVGLVGSTALGTITLVMDLEDRVVVSTKKSDLLRTKCR